MYMYDYMYIHAEFSPGLFSMVLRHATCLEFYLVTLIKTESKKKEKKNRKETLYYYNHLNLHSLRVNWNTRHLIKIHRTHPSILGSLYHRVLICVKLNHCHAYFRCRVFQLIPLFFPRGVKCK